jgi:hypothetical protein
MSSDSPGLANAQTLGGQLAHQPRARGNAGLAGPVAQVVRAHA